MRVIQLHTRYRQQGGEDSVVDYEFELLRTAGHQVARHERDNPTTPLDAAASMAVAISNPMAAKAARRAVESFQPDIVHVHNTWFGMSPSVITAAHRAAPVVMTVHNYRMVCANGQLFRAGKVCNLCVEGTLWNGVIHKCYRGPVSSAIAAATIAFNRDATWRDDVDLFLVLSNFAADLLIESGIPREKVVVKSNFVADPGPRPIAAHESKRVLFAGRLSDEKGVMKLLENHRLFKALGLTLEIAGDGPLRPQIERALAGSYLGPMAPSEVSEIMLQSRALILPSLWYEGQPRTALEAFAAGLPVLGAELGAIGELLQKQGPGWTFNPTSEWTSVVSRLTDPGFVEKGSASARDLFEKSFNPTAGIRNLERSYAAAILRHEEACRPGFHQRNGIQVSGASDS